ncbi:MAG: bifunctional oligoribonuclease/PAP phosphatase NrnA [Sulfurovum sp.]|nr:bifunctional oligoribonuclease/PAP phosphatase NrnA [Sulfurovum sp.]
MKTLSLPFIEVKEKIDQAQHITLLSHLNPDADTLGTSLGIYALLKKAGKKVEVANASKHLPQYLDFLPNFSKIKGKMDYEDSLIIACDCGSIDRLGFDLTGRDIINIDHHHSNEGYGSLNVIVSHFASASQVAYVLFDRLYDIDAATATCFYTALLSDTRYFTTAAVTEDVFAMAKDLIARGAKPEKIAYNFTQRRPLASLRILEKALASLSLHHEAKIATLFVTQEQILASGASTPDMEGIVDYARSLVTVEVALFAIELGSDVRISLRSKKVDVSQVALAFGGGGHKLAAGFTLKQCGLQESMDKIIQKIHTLKLLD